MAETQELRVKNNTVSLDAMDIEILRALQKDSSETYAAMGKRFGIAHSTVRDRIRKMEQQGVIQNYTATIDAEKIGLRNITAMMTVYTDPKETERVAEKLAALPEVLEAYTSLSEELLIIAKVSAASQENLHEFIANSVAPLPGVSRIRTSIITKKFKETQFSITEASKKVNL
ncbi:MAG: Lrp/AsnC family transcriptional regulator [Candidatus Bathyarchaeia archaeon]|jgi:Lrp/AsnC family leucine-responsive transcriptional regulator